MARKTRSAPLAFRAPSFSFKSVRNSAFDLGFRHEWVAFVLIPLAIFQLLMYLSAPAEHGMLIGIFIATYFFVGHYTRDAEYKLGVPMLLTFVIARYDILKQNMWEGLANGAEGDEGDDADAEDDEAEGDAAEDADAKGGALLGAGAGDTDEEKTEEFQNKSAPSNVDINDTSAMMNDTLNNLDHTLGRLENSYDRIMKIGSKLGINNQLNALTKSIDITGILNQKKELK